MRVVHVLLPVLLFGCAAPMPTPPLTATAPAAGSQGPTREVVFRAEADETQLAATCALDGPGLDLEVVTPARVALPLRPDGRAAVSQVACASGGQVRSWAGIPGEETRLVTFEFGGGLGEVMFQRADASVLYYGRGGQLVEVQGSPDP